MSKYSEKVERRKLAALEEEKNERAARAVNAVKPTTATDPFSVIPDPIVRTFMRTRAGLEGNSCPVYSNLFFDVKPIVFKTLLQTRYCGIVTPITELLAIPLAEIERSLKSRHKVVLNIICTPYGGWMKCLVKKGEAKIGRTAQFNLSIVALEPPGKCILKENRRKWKLEKRIITI